MILILVSVVVALLFYLGCVRPFSYWAKRGVSQYNLWTTWKDILVIVFCYRSVADGIKKCYDKFPGKRYVGIYQFNRPMLLLRDPELIKQICVKDFHHFVDHYNTISKNIEPLWEKALFSLQGDKWKDIRCILSPSFTSSKMKMMFGLATTCAEQVVEYFEEGPQTVEMKDVFTRYANDVIASAAFGVTCNSLRDRNNEFYLMGREITNFENISAKIRCTVIIAAPRLARALGMRFFSTTASNFFRRVIKSNVEAREKYGIIRHDLINFLLEARREKQKLEGTEDEHKALSGKEKEKLLVRELSDEDITAHAVLFFFAGFDTISTMMCFMAYELALHPAVQQRLQNEIEETLKYCNGSVTYDSLMNMKYMDMVVSESLRKWSGGIGVDRCCTKDYIIEPVDDGEKPVHLKEGDVVLIPIPCLHKDSQWYPNPDRFDPERFSSENKSSVNPYMYLPFGLGPRGCIAKRFGLMEIKLAYFHILSKFNIKVVDKTTVPVKILCTQFQLVAENGIWLGLERKKRS